MKISSLLREFFTLRSLFVALITIPIVLGAVQYQLILNSRNQQKLVNHAQSVIRSIGITPTATPTPILTIVPTFVGNKTTSVIPTSLPTITPSTILYSPGRFSIQGAQISSEFPQVSVAPDNQAVAFTVTSTGTHGFSIIDVRIFGLGGISLSPTEASINIGETKEVIVRVPSTVAPGEYGGYVTVKVDNNVSVTLMLTVHVTGSQASSTPSMEITGPAAGSSYNECSNITVRWNASNITTDFELRLISENGVETIIGSVPNSARSYTWKIPSSFDLPDKTATHYIFAIGGANRLIFSTKFFTINHICYNPAQ